MEQLEALPIAPSQFDESALLSPRRDEPKAIEYPTSQTEQITTSGAKCITRLCQLLPVFCSSNPTELRQKLP